MLFRSAERVSKELLKLLVAPDPRPAVRAMAETGVLARILPEADQPAAFEVMVGLSDDSALRLSALLSSDPAKVEAAAKRLRLPNAMRDRLQAAAGGEVALETDARTARAQIYRLSKPTFVDRVLRAEAISNRPGAGAALLELAEIGRAHV